LLLTAGLVSTSLQRDRERERG